MARPTSLELWHEYPVDSDVDLIVTTIARGTHTCVALYIDDEVAHTYVIDTRRWRAAERALLAAWDEMAEGETYDEVIAAFCVALESVIPRDEDGSVS
jgi:hypothetical protein